MITNFIQLDFNKENDCTMFDYEHVKTITKVDTDENGIWFFEYN